MLKLKNKNKMKKILELLHIHWWNYTDGGLTRECRCGKFQITVGEEPALYRMAGDKWVTTVQ